MADVVEIDASTGQTTHRDFTPEESAQRAIDQAEHETRSAAEVVLSGNKTSIEVQAQQALGNNRAFIALSAPTNPQVLAQVKDLSRQMNGVIRLLLNQLDGTD